MSTVRPRAAGANMSVDVEGTNLPIRCSHATLPRIDVIGRRDGVEFARRGTPTSGATLANLAGAPQCDEAHRLGWVLVPAGANTITSANVRAWDAGLEARFRELEQEIANGHG